MVIGGVIGSTIDMVIDIAIGCAPAAAKPETFLSFAGRQALLMSTP